MKSLFDKPVCEELLQRIDQLSPESIMGKNECYSNVSAFRSWHGYGIWKT